MLDPADKVQLSLSVGEDEVVIKPIVVPARALAQHLAQPRGRPGE